MTLPRIALASLAFLLGGCHVDFSGLSDLADPNPTYFDLPGRRLEAGHFERATIDGTDAAGAYVIAFEAHADTSRLALVPFDGSPSCRTGHADRYKAQAPQIGTRSTLTPFVQFVEDANGSTPSRLHFANPSCKEPFAPIDGSGFPFAIWGTGDTDAGYLARTTTGDLLSVKPWATRKKLVANSTTGAILAANKLWTIEGRTRTDGVAVTELVVRSSSLEVLARFGTGVKELDVTTDAVTRAAYIDVTQAPPEPGQATPPPPESSLYVVTDKLGTPVKVDSDACNVSFPLGWRGFGVSYFSPCASRRLVLYGSAHLKDPGPGQSDTKHVLGDGALRDGALATPLVQFVDNDAIAFFITNDDPKAATGTLWGGVIDQTPEHVADLPQVTRSRAPIMMRIGSSWYAIVSIDGNGVGTLIRWNPGAAVEELATNAVEIVPPLAVVRFDGKLGELVHLDDGRQTKTLARSVPRGTIVSGPDGRFAALADFDGAQGTLLASSGDSAVFEKIATHVLPGSYVFTPVKLAPDPVRGTAASNASNRHAIGYLHDIDTAGSTGVLAVRFIETGDTFDAGVRASEWRPVDWPEPGVLYVVPSGEHAGIWFARLK